MIARVCVERAEAQVEVVQRGVHDGHARDPDTELASQHRMGGQVGARPGRHDQ